MKNKFGLITLTALVAGNMIGSGVFLLPSEMASFGSVSLYAWIFSTIGALCLALVFIRLNQLYPKRGGPYAYSRIVLGDFLGFQAAYNYWLAMWVGDTAVVVATVGYLSVFFPSLADPHKAVLMGLAIIWIITFINTKGMQEVGAMQLITTILKILPLLIIIIFGWHFLHPNYYSRYFNISQPHHSNFSLLSMSIVLTFWSFLGLESATVPAANIDNPKRNIPLATMIGLLITSAVYILSTAVVFGMMPAPLLSHSASPFADAANMILGHWGYWLIAAGAAITCLGCLNGWMMMQGQVALAAADDKLFPAIFTKRNKKGLPLGALIISACCMSILLLTTMSGSLVKQFQDILFFATFANLIPYLYSAIAEFILLKRAKQNLHKVRLRVLTIIIAIIFSIWAMFSSGEWAVTSGLFVLACSVPLYFATVKPRIKQFKKNI